jgi:hypothetical protein
MLQHFTADYNVEKSVGKWQMPHIGAGQEIGPTPVQTQLPVEIEPVAGRHQIGRAPIHTDHQGVDQADGLGAVASGAAANVQYPNPGPGGQVFKINGNHRIKADPLPPAINASWIDRLANGVKAWGQTVLLFISL